MEFYNLVHLNKHLVVAFHANAYFPLCCEVFLYFIVLVEVAGIQICLQIIKRIEKEKDFSNSYLVMGRNPAHPGVSPAHPPFTFSYSRPSSRPSDPAPAQRH
jgi:hypothetical protein